MRPASASSARRAGYRWVERLDPARAHRRHRDRPSPRASRAVGARACRAWRRDRHCLPLSRSIAPHAPAGPGAPPGHGAGADALRRGDYGGEKIAAFGDYDVDGAASVALIERYLRAHGQSALTYIPDRLTEGYGPTPEALRGAREDGARLILTLDCGTMAGAAIDAANAAGRRSDRHRSSPGRRGSAARVRRR